MCEAKCGIEQEERGGMRGGGLCPPYGPSVDCTVSRTWREQPWPRQQADKKHWYKSRSRHRKWLLCFVVGVQHREKHFEIFKVR